ncbi:MAG: hypothetical protein Q9191_008050, partial [Dirinaria sp. TL-2023a]
MAFDKQSTANAKSVANPRLAGGGTPLPRAARSPALNTSSIVPKAPKANGTRTPNGQSEEEVSTPVKAFLNSNITPRSSSRKARLNSASPTPNGTPNGTPKSARPVSMIERWDDGLAGREDGMAVLGIQGVDGRTKRAQSISSDVPSRKIYSRPLSVQSGPAESRVASPDSSLGFFRADEAKPRVPSRPDQRPALRTVFSGYTQDGHNDDDGSRTSLSTSPPLEDKRPKFFRANSSSEAASPPWNRASTAI